MMNEIIERLKQGDWYVTCSEVYEYDYLMQLCVKAQLKWSDGNDEPTEWHLHTSIFPIIISVSTKIKNGYHEPLHLCWSPRSTYIPEYIENITNKIFSTQSYPILIRNIISTYPFEIQKEWYENLLLRHKLPIIKEMWDIVPKNYNYAAMDIDKKIHFFEIEPTLFDNGYWLPKGDNLLDFFIFGIDTKNINYRYSLTQRI